MNWKTEEHRNVYVAGTANLELTLESEAADLEVVKLVEELQASIDILLKDYERQVTEIRDKNATEQQRALYRILSFGVNPIQYRGVDIGSSDGDHSAYTILGRAEAQDTDDSESEET